MVRRQWQDVRVFISSTFRDMEAERDYLVKRVFPQLRERLLPYRIHLIDIDLRWGITPEEAENDRVLDLCLQQIDDCRPFFVGILGERYGWVPNRIMLPDEPEYGWIQGMTGKSVTLPVDRKAYDRLLAKLVRTSKVKKSAKPASARAQKVEVFTK